MAAQKVTWLRRKLDWFENHKVFGPLLLLLFVLSVIGGFVSFAREAVSLVNTLFNEQKSEIRATVEIQNARATPISIDPICDFELIEKVRNMTTSYLSQDNGLRLLPVETVSGTNHFQIASGEKRCFQVRFPDNQLHRDLLDRGAAVMKLSVWTTAGELADANVPFERSLIRKTKVAIRF